MLFALRHPALLLGLALGFLVGVIVRAMLAQRLATPRRPGGRRLRAVGGRRPRSSRPLASYLDPYGAVAAVIAGIGWGARPMTRPVRGLAAVSPLLVALTVHAVLAAVGFAGYLAAGGTREVIHLVSVSDIVHGAHTVPGFARQVSLGFAMVNVGCGLLALIPIPPLELGILLWSRLPRTPGARRLAYHLLEEAWGVAIVLVGLLLPLAGQPPAFLAVVDALADPLLRQV